MVTSQVDYLNMGVFFPSHLGRPGCVCETQPSEYLTTKQRCRLGTREAVGMLTGFWIEKKKEALSRSV